MPWPCTTSTAAGISVAAKSYALQALGFEGSPTREGAIRHRVARLDRKLERTEPFSASLF